MKRTTIISFLIFSVFIFSTCDQILNPNPASRWNPLDPLYDSETDPDYVEGTDPDPDSGLGPVVTINGTITDTTPRQTKSWSWSVDTAGCVFRSAVTQNADFTFSNEPYSTGTTASQNDGDGVYYLFVQAKTSEEELGPVASASALLDNTPPDVLSAIATIERHARINLSWTNPADDFDHVEIRYSTGTWPVTIADGTQIYTGTAEEYSHTGLSELTSYYYSGFTYDDAGNYSTATQAFATADVERPLAYLASGSYGLKIVDAYDYMAPVLLGECDTPGNASDVYVAGSYAYVADGTSGLQVIDVSNVESPSIIGTYDTAGNATGVYVAEGYAYIADSTNGLATINVSNPYNPSFAGSVAGSNYANKVHVSGSYAYVAWGDLGLRVFNISNPASPQIEDDYNTPGHAQNIYVYGTYAIVADASSGIIVINAAAPDNLLYFDDVPTYNNAVGVYVEGYDAYVADSSAGFEVIDLSSSSITGYLDGTNWTGWPTEVQVIGNYAYVATDHEFAVVDVSNKTAPSITGSYSAAYAAAVYVGFND